MLPKNDYDEFFTVRYIKFKLKNLELDVHGQKNAFEYIVNDLDIFGYFCSIFWKSLR